MTDPLGLEEAARLLVDAKSESRQRAATGIAQRAASLFREQPGEEACRTLLAGRDRIQHFYLNAVPAAYRRAGMIAVRAILSNLPARSFPEPVVQGYTLLAVNSVTDADPVVRVTTVEALHELTRRFGEQALQLCFAPLFRALTCAIGDADTRVSALAQEVSLSAKEVVSGSQQCPIDPDAFAQFVHDALLPLAGSGAGYKRQGNGRGANSDGIPSENGVAVIVAWALDWTSFMLDTPGTNVIASLPQLLPSLLRVAASTRLSLAADGVGSSPIPARAADVLLACRYELARAVAVRGAHAANVDRVVRILLDIIRADDAPNASEGCHEDALAAWPPAVQHLCLGWLQELVALSTSWNADGTGNVRVALPYDAILRGVLPRLASRDASVRKAAESANADLARMIAAGSSMHEEPGSRATNGKRMAEQLVAAVTSFFSATLLGSPCGDGAELLGTARLSADEDVLRAEAACRGGVQWYGLLLRSWPTAVLEHDDDIRRVLVLLLCGPCLCVSRAAAEVLLGLVGAEDDARFSLAVAEVLALVQSHAARVLPRLPALVKTLQASIEGAASGKDAPLPFPRCERLMVSMAKTLSAMGDGSGTVADVRFVAKGVIVLNMVLLTSDEFANLRALLRGCASSRESSLDGDRSEARSWDVFAHLCAAWQYSAIPLLSLCLLSGQHGMALAVCRHVGSSEPSAAALVQLDRLAQLLEGPVFADLRLQLLRPLECPALVETLYAVLMLLPLVSPQYDVLHRRLALVLGLAQFQPHAREREEKPSWQPLLARFVACQATVWEAETRAAAQDASLS